MTGLGVDRLGLAAVSLAGSRVDQRHAAKPAHLLEVNRPTAVWHLSAKGTALDTRRVGRKRSSPRPEPSVEHGLGAMAKVAEKEPQPRRHGATHVVVSDNFCVGAHAGPAHRFLELIRRRQRVPPTSPGSRYVLEVDEHGSREMAARVLVATVPALQVPAKVDDA